MTYERYAQNDPTRVIIAIAHNLIPLATNFAINRCELPQRCVFYSLYLKSVFDFNFAQVLHVKIRTKRKLLQRPRHFCWHSQRRQLLKSHRNFFYSRVQ